MAVGVVLVMICILTAAGPAAAQQERATPAVTRDPEAVRLEVSDLRRFASLMRILVSGTGSDTVDLIEREYIQRGTPGLRAYVRRYDISAESLVEAVKRRPATYHALDELADSILARGANVRAALRRLQELLPAAVFPPVWFLAGTHGPAGLTRPEGVLIAAERFADSASRVVPLVLHEVAHYQQAVLQGIDAYQRLYSGDATLLGLALREGAAELVAELTTGSHINPAAAAYGLPREELLWKEFQRDMLGSSPGEWMFVTPADPDRPADLGYWIGYRIARHYFDRAHDKQRALREILSITDFEAFLRTSGYGGRRRQ